MHLLPHRAAVQRANDALWLVGLGEERFRPVGTMSTGQRQRVKLASAIAHDPELVLLDEPTDGLDPMQRTEMLDLIRRIGTEFGMHIIVSSHHLEEVERICDGVVIVEGGEVVHAGTLADVRRGPEGLVVEVDGRADELASILIGARLRRDRRGRRAPARRRATASTTPFATRSPTSGSGCGGSGRADGRSRTSTWGPARDDRAGRAALRPRLPRATTARASGRPGRSSRWPSSRCGACSGWAAARRHKVLPAITLAIAFLPALVSVAVAAIVDVDPARRPDHLRRVHVLHRQRARALRGARRSRGALPGPAHGNARPLSRRAARPQPLSPRQGRSASSRSCS